MDYAIFPFWDDLYVYGGTRQGVYYEIVGTAPNRQVSIEWNTSPSGYPGYPDQYFHFTATFQETDPNFDDGAVSGAPVFSYHEISDAGVSATVGQQSQSSGLFTQYSYNTADITPGLELTYNRSTKAYEVTSSGDCVA